MYKTKDVTRIVGVTPPTLYRWGKFFQLTFKTNERGHYIFTEAQVQLFKYVHKQIESGKTLEEISTNDRDAFAHENHEQPLIHSFQSLTDRVNAFESMLANKADDVVCTQILQHRTEIDRLHTIIEQLQGELDELDQSVKVAKESHDSANATGNVTKKKNFLALFGKGVV